MALSSSSLRAAPARGGLRRGLMAPAPATARRFARAGRVQASGDAAASASYDDASSSVHPLASADFDDFVGSGYVIVDCFTDWCGPCKMIAPKFSELAATATPHVRFAKYDCQSDPKRSSALGIKALPSFLAFKDGVEVGRMVGSKKDELERFVEEHRAAAEAAAASAEGASVPAAAAVTA